MSLVANGKRAQHKGFYVRRISRNGVLFPEIPRKIRKPRTCSEETKRKTSIRKTGKTRSEETRKKMSLNSGNKKTFEIVYPDGKIEIVKNLPEFCRRHNLTHTAMCAVARGLHPKHKNFKCRKIDDIS